MFISNNDIEKIRKKIHGQRVAGMDFGIKRIGLAVTDELHISTQPAITLENEPSTLWGRLEKFIIDERISAIVMGFPITMDGEEIPIHEEIKKFSVEINQRYGLSVYFIDESYTSQSAGNIMDKIGKKKKYRQTKGNTDKFAAAEILREFLILIEG